MPAPTLAVTSGAGLCRATSTLDRDRQADAQRMIAAAPAGSSAMRTGTRCTILIQLPVAFCGGSSAKALPRARAQALDMAVIGDAAAIDVGA